MTKLVSLISKNYYTGDKLKNVILVFLFIILFLSIFKANQYIADVNLDSSWVNALNYFANNNFAFGSEVIFTYGPLGWLYTNSYDPNLYWYKIGHFALLALYTCYLMFKLMKYSSYYFFLLSIFSLILFRADDSLIFFLILNSCLLFQVSNSKKILSLPYLFIIIFISFIGLMKFSFLIAGIFVLCLMLIDLILKSKVKLALWTLSLFLLLFVFFWTISNQSITAIPGYLVNSYFILASYNEAMAINGPFREILLSYLIIIFFILSLPINRIFRNKSIINSMKILVFLVPVIFFVFISWKSGYVRHDEHVFIFLFFLSYLPITLSVLNNQTVHLPSQASGNNAGYNKTNGLKDTYIGSLETRKIFIFITYILSIMSILYIASYRFENYNIMSERSSEIIRQIKFITQPKLMVEQKYLLENTLKEVQVKHALPLIKDYVGSDSVDIYNFQQSYVLFNELNWKPRPVFQGYSAYNTALLQKNKQQLADHYGPEYILFKVQSIDNRYPLTDDTLWVKEVFHYYKPILIENNFILFEKIHNVKNAEERASEKVTYLGLINEPIQINMNSDKLYATIDIEYNIFGKIRSLFFKPPEVYMEIKLSNGDEKQYRIIPGIVENPFLISPLIETNEDLLKTLAGINDKKVLEIKIVSKSVKYIKPEIEFSFYDFNFDNNFKREDYMAILMNDAKIVSKDSLIDDQNYIIQETGIYYIDYINNNLLNNLGESIVIEKDSLLNISGWAFNEYELNVPEIVILRFRSTENQGDFYVEAVRNPRVDVAEHFGSTELESSGFHGNFVLENLPRGIYHIDILQKDKDTIILPKYDHSAAIKINIK